MTDFVESYHADDVSKRIATPVFRKFGNSDIVAGDKANLDVQWRTRETDANRGPSPQTLMQEILKDLEEAMREFAAAESELGRLALDEIPYVRWRVASNASVPLELLRRLAADEDLRVRAGVAGNASTPRELLGRLAADQNSSVRKRVAGNASTPSELLGGLAADEDRFVRLYVAGNFRLLLEDLL